MTATSAPPRIVVMGVSAAGKSTVAKGVAEALGIPFVDADDLHPPSNVTKMAGGEALTDDDRAPWLTLVGEALANAERGLVIACSALRRRYRDQIRDAASDAFFIFLDADPALLRARAAARANHFMPPALLHSQLATLEPLEADEPGVRIDVEPAPEMVIAEAIKSIKT
ncbi:gluconokinase [Microbacterium lacus]|uniref:gluconokinase n=1 Tax=Microbacterium lacus TaxID=415217 RepID=UPI00384E708A